MWNAFALASRCRSLQASASPDSWRVALQGTGALAWPVRSRRHDCALILNNRAAAAVFQPSLAIRSALRGRQGMESCAASFGRQSRRNTCWYGVNREMSKRELGRPSFAESTAAIAWPNWAAAPHRIDPVAGSSSSGATPEQAAARVLDRADVASPQSIATPQGECFPRHTGSPEIVTRAWAAHRLALPLRSWPSLAVPLGVSPQDLW